MKLTVQDLQIGDYFHRPDCIDKVVEIRKNGVIGLDSLRGLVGFTEIAPIPITPEILKNNGFEEVGDNIYQLDVKSHWFWVDFDQYVLGCDLNTSTHEQENSFRILCVNSSLFVHELQQAMRLCNIKKEIKL